jgi:hypothetical protein
MSAAIYLLQNDDTLVAMSSAPYDSERLLQDLLAKYPDLLAGEQMGGETPRRWLLVSQELPLPSEEGGGGRWAVDHLFLDQDGVPTIVEVKRCSDSRIRREVVGQMLDYAANAVVYWPVEDIRARYEAASAGSSQVMGEFLGEGADPGEFWQRVKTNLQAGRVRMVFVADRVPPELRRIVEFLNLQMDPAEVLALEVEQFVGSGLRTLVPRIVGQTADAQRRKSAGTGTGRQWDDSSFFEALEERGPDATKAARQIQTWATENGARIEYGSGRRTGSMIPTFTHLGRHYYLFAAYTYGNIEIYFQWLKGKPPFDDETKRLELLERLNQVRGVDIPLDAINRRPSIRLDSLAASDVINPFLGVLDWVLKEIRDTDAS